MANAETAYGELQQRGRFLAEGRWRKLVGKLLRKNEDKAIITAILLENQRKWFSNLTEDVKMLNVGSFDRFAFPMIRAIYPNLVATDLVSVQPMQGPTSLIFFLEQQYGVTKGSAVQGASALSPISGHPGPRGFSSEWVDHETLGTGSTGDDTPTMANLDWFPVRPGSVTIHVLLSTVDTTYTDDGNGGFTGLDAGTIDYATGQFTVAPDFPTAPDNLSEIWVKYRYVSEANTLRPKLDITLTSTQVMAETHSMVTNWSVESEQDFKAVHGLDAQTTLMSQVAENIRFEIDREVIADLWDAAGGTTGTADITWDYTPPTGVDFYRHQLTFINKLVEASNLIFANTRGKGRGTWLVCGVNVATVIEALPGFVPTDYGDAEGVVFIGQLGSLKIYKDPWAATDWALMGYKGSSWLKAGYVYAPYVPLWRTPVITLTDIARRVGLMTRFAKKLINGYYYVTVNVDNFGVLS